MIGATQNSHSWSTAMAGPNSAGPVLRAGLTEVLVTGIETRWIKVRHKPIASAAEARGAVPGRRAEDHDQEDGGQHDLGQQRRLEAEAARRMFAEAVGREAADLGARLAGGDHVEHEGRGDGAEHLGDDVAGQLGGAEAPADHQAHRHGGIEVAPGDRAEGIGAGQHREAEGQRDTDEADAQAWEGGGQ